MQPELSGKVLAFVVGAFAHGKVRMTGVGVGMGLDGWMGACATHAWNDPPSNHCLALSQLSPWAVPPCPSPQIDDSYVDQYISISQFPLSAAYALGRITNALERKWGIV